MSFSEMNPNLYMSDAALETFKRVNCAPIAGEFVSKRAARVVPATETVIVTDVSDAVPPRQFAIDRPIVHPDRANLPA